MIIVDARSGLANRMQAIDSARSLARDLDRQFVIPWVLNSACGARFSALFSEVVFDGDLLHFESNADADAFIAAQGSHLLRPWCDVPNSQMPLSLGNVQQHPIVVIRSWARFYSTPDPYSSFTPVNGLLDRILRVTSGFDRTVWYPHPKD